MWWLLSCARPPEPHDDPVALDLSLTQIRDDVERIASDATGGRVPGTPGHDAARDYLAAEMAAAGLVPPIGEDDLLEEVSLTLERARFGLDADGQVFAVPSEVPGANLLGLRPGADPARADEVVLLVAHYDHLGVDEQGNVYNGAFDDATAVCVLLELARALDRGAVQLPRTVGFLFTDAEEDGLDGADLWLASPSVAVEDLVAVLSVDPIGRPLLPDYAPLFTIGAERSPELTAAVRDLPGEVRRLSQAGVYGFASDQDVFWAAGVPALWISSGGMTFYHSTADDPETIDYASVQAHAAAIADLAVSLASGATRPRDEGRQPLSVDDLREAVATIDGALGSAELTDEERALGAQYRDDLSAGVDADDASDPALLTTYVSLLLYVITDLAVAHPGPIPPPFPAAADAGGG